MSDDYVCFSYEVAVASAIDRFLPKDQRSQFEKWKAGRGGARIDVTLGDRALRIDYGSDAESIHVDAQSGRRTLLNHRAKQRLILDHGSSTLHGPFESWARTKASFPGIRRKVVCGSKELWSSRVDIPYAELRAEGWAIHGPTPATAGLFWTMLTGASNLLHQRLGPPAAVVLFDPDDATEPLVTLRLVEVAAGSMDLVRYDGYRPSGEERPVLRGADLSRRVRATAARRANTTGRLAAAHLAYRESVDRVRGVYDFFTRGDDCAWITNQPALDQIKEVVNSLTGVMGTFAGDGNGGENALHVVVDWFQKLEPHLTFSTDAMTMIKDLWLLYKVINAESLPELGEAETREYVDMLDARPDALGRALAFLSVFSQSRRAQLADACFSELTKAVVVDSGIKEHEETVLDLLNLKLWDFDCEVTFDDAGLLEEIRYHRWKLRLLVRLKNVYVDFQFSTVPAGTATSILLAILTLGGTALIATNYGTGYANIDDAKIALDVSSVVQNGALTYRVNVNRDDSDMDSSAFAFGVNLGQDVLDAIAAAVVSWCNVLNGTILDKVAGVVEKAAGSFPLAWTKAWNARRRPPSLVASGSRDGTRVLRGQLVESPSGMPPSLTSAVPQRVRSHGYSVSRQHLSAWLRNIAPAFSVDRIASLDWETHFGITLPDINALGLPTELQQSLQGLNNTEVGRYYRTRVVRHPPVVTFPQQGTVSDAGNVEMICDVYLEAVVQIASTYWSFEGGFTMRGPARHHDGEYRAGGIAQGGHARLRRAGRSAYEIAGGFLIGEEQRFPPIPIPPSPDFPQFDPFAMPDQPLEVFETPKLVPHTVVSEHAFYRLVEVRLKVTGKLRLGFTSLGDLWLPELTLGLIADTADSALPALSEQLVAASTNAPLAGIPSADLYNFVRATCRDDVVGILGPALVETSAQPQNNRSLVPGFVDLFGSGAAELVSLIVFSQDPSPADADSFTYFVDGDLLYWGVTVDQTISSYVR
jgi:hypothetical protein